MTPDVPLQAPTLGRIVHLWIDGIQPHPIAAIVTCADPRNGNSVSLTGFYPYVLSGAGHPFVFADLVPHESETDVFPRWGWPPRS